MRLPEFVHDMIAVVVISGAVLGLYLIGIFLYDHL
jgi:hypothetical protein